MPNRVADLESTVAQLKATVDGLREELVDANERIRALEQELDTAESTSSDTTRGQTSEVKDNGESESPPASIDDIIVA